MRESILSLVDFVCLFLFSNGTSQAGVVLYCTVGVDVSVDVSADVSIERWSTQDKDGIQD